MWVVDAGREVDLHLDNGFYTTARGQFLDVVGSINIIST